MLKAAKPPPSPAKGRAGEGSPKPEHRTATCFLMTNGRTKKKAASRRGLFYSASSRPPIIGGQPEQRFVSKRDDVLCLRAFLTLGDGEAHALAFGQSLEAGAGDGAEVCEHIRATLLLNKAETFGFIEPFDGASDCARHSIHPVKQE